MVSMKTAVAVSLPGIELRPHSNVPNGTGPLSW